MTHGSEMEDRVESVIHEVITGFDPSVKDSYETCLRQIASIESEVKEIGVEGLREALLARTRACVISMAHQMGNAQYVEELSDEYVQRFSRDDPDFGTTVLFRISALHVLGRHEDELREVGRYAETCFEGESLIFLLDRVGRDHPGSLIWTSALAERIREFVASRSELDEGAQEFPVDDMGRAEWLRDLARRIRASNRERVERALAGR